MGVREEHRLRAFKNRGLRKILGSQRGRVPIEWREDYVKGHIQKTEVHTGFCWGNLRERDHLEDRRIDGSILK